LPAIRPRDLLTDALLGQLHGADLPAGAAGTCASESAALGRDFGLLREAGYLTVTLPRELGGLGCTLRQAACGQRRLAGVAPLTALAVSAHLYWTGAAADAYRSCEDDSVSWILEEAARGATFGGGHEEPGMDLKFASPDSRCAPDGQGGWKFRSPAAASSLTPDWDWLAVHALDESAAAPRAAILAFAGRRGHRVARVLPAGAPSDVFTASATGWGCALLASVEFSAARRAFRQAVAVAGAPRCKPDRAGHPLDRWPVAEASLRLDAMKARIADVTHPWPLVPAPGPDLGGQHMISVYAMRREIAEGSAAVRRLSAQIADKTSTTTGMIIGRRR
jgi:alkylation response protein AidB-like acyl-CoA dehydrogenase